MSQAEKLIELIVKNGLTTYKTKNSRHKYIQETPVVKDKQGVVFGFRTKEHMTESRGFVMSSLESVLENQEKLSHW
ncbi:replication initiation protein, partial [Listeria monocytogenes]|nr:replication protein RepR [Listeria monocytogenes]EAE7595901.1 replication protein RepR [Listeria monocytogenes]EAE7639662.1 replication protein RepR [Listeria monocytogenes]EHE2666170.1 replication protein RepR [Listeria monocytogenes]EHE2743081.1 replication protein RepR [Listeria monocytogenes]